MAEMLIADDNSQITSILGEYAKKEGFHVTIVHDGEAALEAFEKKNFTIILLDVMMPGSDGFSVCRQIRKTSNVPVIMITARGEDFERIMGLDTGADDYIVKPFSPAEVMARIRAVLRRADRDGAADNAVAVCQGLVINGQDMTAFMEGNLLSLTKKEFELLWLFANNPEKVFTRESLLNQIWGYEYFGDSRTVDSHIKRLRAKMDAFSHPNYGISTVWGMGYKFEVLSHEE